MFQFEDVVGVVEGLGDAEAHWADTGSLGGSYLSDGLQFRAFASGMVTRATEHLFATNRDTLGGANGYGGGPVPDYGCVYQASGWSRRTSLTCISLYDIFILRHSIRGVVALISGGARRHLPSIFRWQW